MEERRKILHAKEKSYDLEGPRQLQARLDHLTDEVACALVLPLKD
jgi:hypothetical protein